MRVNGNNAGGSCGRAWQPPPASGSSTSTCLDSLLSRKRDDVIATELAQGIFGLTAQASALLSAAGVDLCTTDAGAFDSACSSSAASRPWQVRSALSVHALSSKSVKGRVEGDAAGRAGFTFPLCAPMRTLRARSRSRSSRTGPCLHHAQRSAHNRAPTVGAGRASKASSSQSAARGAGAQRGVRGRRAARRAHRHATRRAQRKQSRLLLATCRLLEWPKSRAT